MRSTTAAALATAILGLCTGMSPAAPRLGILSTPASRAEADLLFAELSTLDVELLERDEIGRVLEEQGLRAGGLTRDATLQLGHLLKADGLALLEKDRDAVVRIRLVTVSPGVIVWYDQVSVEETGDGEMGAWAKLVAGALAAYLPKLAIGSEAAIPVSLLRTEAQVNSPLARRWAGDLHRLLQLRLVREPSLFVLERENLMRMEEEHRWAGKVSDFWTGSYLLAGAVSHGVAETNRVQFSVSLSPPAEGGAKAAPIEYVESAAAADLPAAVDRVVGKLTAHLGGEASAAAWEPLAEARRFVALASRQPNLELRRAHLETAMALGLRTPDVAAKYCEVFTYAVARQWDRDGFGQSRFFNTGSAEAVRQHAELILAMLRFCNSYEPPDSFTPKQKTRWLKQCVIDMDGPIVLTAKALRYAVSANRLDDLGPLCNDMRREARRLAHRVWFRDEHRPLARSGHLHVRYARYIVDSSSDLVRLLAWIVGPSGASREDEALPSLKRELIDPVFPSSAEDTTVVRDARWQAFLKDCEVLKNPLALLDLQKQEYKAATSPKTQREVRAKIHRTLCDNVELFAANEHAILTFVVDHCAYPRLKVRDGAYWIGGRRGRPASTGEAREIADTAREFLMALLEHRPLMRRDDTVLLDTYWPLMRTEDAKILLESLRANARKFDDQPGLKKELLNGNSVWVPKEDMHDFIGAFLERFPELKDVKFAARAEQIAAKRTEAQAGRLQVTRLIEWPYTSWTSHRHSSRCARGAGPYWKDGKLWFHHYGELLMLDPRTEKVTKLGDTDVPCTHFGSTELDNVFTLATRSFVVFVVNGHMDWNPATLKGSRRWMPPTTLTWCTRKGTDRRSVTCKAYIKDVAQVDDVLYVLTEQRAPLWSGAGRCRRGLVRVSDDGSSLAPVLDPLTMETASKSARQLGAAEKLAFTNGEFLVKCGKWHSSPIQAWNPETRAWRAAEKAEWRAAVDDQEPHVTASDPFGFEIVKLDGSASPPKLILCRPGMRDKVIWNRFRRGEKRETVSVPLECAKAIEKHHRPAIMTRRAVLLSLARDTPGFHVVPYDDIRDWLQHNTAFLANEEPER